METLRVQISNAVNELQKMLKFLSGGEEETRLRRLRSLYFGLWQQVILQEIDNQTAEYRAAVESLLRASDTAQAAQEDKNLVSAAIAELDQAVAAVEKVLR